jgi:Multicopper oxidase
MHIGANVGRITLAARYGPELGEYMVHCHNNVHEDNDMFRAFMVRTAACMTLSRYADPVSMQSSRLCTCSSVAAASLQASHITTHS